MVQALKKELRREFLLRRNSLSLEEIKEKSLRIKERLFNLKEFKGADFILFYVSKGSEVRTHEMIKEVLTRNKRVAVPITLKEKGELLLSEIKDLDELELGNFGILEPKEEYRRIINPKAIDLGIIPGIAFSLSGYRLGYGGGYFDRLLSRVKMMTIGLAYQIQIIDYLPTDEKDVRLDKIITEIM